MNLFFPSLLQIMLELRSFIFNPKLWILIIMIHVQVLVDCSGDDRSEKSPEMAFSNKKSALLQLVEGSPVPKTIVFCNKVRWSIYLCGLHQLSLCAITSLLTFFLFRRKKTLSSVI